MTMAFSLARRLAAEALGAGLLVATVVGSGVMAAKLADGNVALALLGNTLPTGAILVVLILALAPLSGAHFNPAVSLVMALTGALPWRELAPYTLAQALGGCLVTLAAHGMFGYPEQFIPQSEMGGRDDGPHRAVAMVRRNRRHLRPPGHDSRRGAVPD